MLKMFICFNLIKANRCLIITIIAPHDLLQSQDQYYTLWYQTLCRSLVQLEGLISVHSTILTRQQNSEYPRSPWISLHKLSGLNYPYFHSSFFDIFTLHKYSQHKVLSSWYPNLSARTKGKVSNLIVGPCVLRDQDVLPIFSVQPLSHMKVSMLVWHYKLPKRADDSGSVLFFMVCVTCKVLTGCL